MTLKQSIRSAKYDVGKSIRPTVVPLTLAISSVLATAPAMANDKAGGGITVISLNGGYQVDICTLRAAIDTVNLGEDSGFNCGDPGSNPTITFASNLSGTISLDDHDSATLTVEESVTIDGDDRITIETSSSDGLFEVEEGVGSFGIHNLELTGGEALNGGAINSSALELEILESVLSGNTALLGNGGAVSHTPPEGQSGALRIQDSVFSNNSAASGAGGAVYALMDGGQVQVDDNGFYNNNAKYGGGLAIEASETDLFFVKYNEFIDNEAFYAYDGDALGSGGGALLAFENVEQAEIKYNNFTSNTANGDGGGLALIASQSEIGFGENSFNFNESSEGEGGGLYAELSDSEFYAGELVFGFNASGLGGGGAQISASGSTVGMQETMFKYNDAGTLGETGFGGGLRISGSLEEFGMSYTAIFGNTARGGAGVSFASASSNGEVIIENAEISNNEAGTTSNPGAGGAIYASLGDDAQMFVTNSTLSGNTGATRGGGIRQDGDFTLQAKYSTIVDNETTDTGGGISASDDGACLVRNTILANEADSNLQDIDGGDCVVSSSLIAGAKYSDYSDGGGNITNVSPQLESLADNGGPTRTHRPEEGSPVIDAGSPFGDAPEYDQRGTGFDRISGDELDMGAYEVQVLEDELFHDRFESSP